MLAASIDAVMRAAAGKADVILVGGQAIAVWTAYYADCPDFGPEAFAATTQDIDFLGSGRRAAEMAAALRARVVFPTAGDATPSSAMLDLGHENSPDERIDFLAYVAGPGDRVAGQAIELMVPLLAESKAPPVLIRIMHPFHCLQSKLENTVTLDRRGISALAQLESSAAILRCFIADMLDGAAGDHRAPEARMAFKTLDALGEYLERHITGRRADQFMVNDPLQILRHFADDPRVPEQFRRHNIDDAVTRITAMRGRRLGSGA
jgi:hypothetical protein